jgi:hypothetical protein
VGPTFIDAAVAVVWVLGAVAIVLALGALLFRDPRKLTVWRMVVKAVPALGRWIPAGRDGDAARRAA